MIVNMSEAATEEEITHVIDRIREAGFQPHVTRGAERTIVAAVGSGGRRHEIEALRVAAGVEDVVSIAQPFKLVSRQVKPERSVVQVGPVKIGGGNGVVVMAGPCSVESREQLISTAHAVKRAGATMLRGGAYKPRTSPYDFQGLGTEALKILREAREETGLTRLRPVRPEVFDVDRHWIPPRGEVSGHWHLDLRFQVEADPDEELSISDESHDLMWVGLARVAVLNPEESMLRMVRKTTGTGGTIPG